MMLFVDELCPNILQTSITPNEDLFIAYAVCVQTNWGYYNVAI